MPRVLAAARSLSLARGYEALILRDGPVGYWRLDDPQGQGVLLDRSGNALHLTPGTNLSYQTAGLLLPRAGNAITMASNSTQMGFIADNATLSITGDITLECWMQRADINVGTYVFMSKGNLSGSVLSYSMFIDGNNGLQLRLSVDGTTVKSVSSVANALLDTNIHHCVGVYRQAATTMEVWLDGRRVGRLTTGPASIFDATQSFRLAAGSTSGDVATQQFNGGTLQECAIYNKPLAPAQIQTHYLKGRWTRALAAARRLA
jgi:hypothetical protein